MSLRFLTKSSHLTSFRFSTKSSHLTSLRKSLAWFEGLGLEIFIVGILSSLLVNEDRHIKGYFIQ